MHPQSWAIHRSSCYWKHECDWRVIKRLLWLCRCVREMYGIAKTNWDAFCGPDIVDLCGHLLIYPMLVNQDGR